ncbi:MAG TPA: hypothetical protein VFI31_06330 [Pirellulales bacterium]|nr:hypothetical protein [Pirellulales bacterium]
MAYHWALVLSLAVLSPSAIPAIAQAQGTPPAGDARSAGGGSAVERFAAAADETKPRLAPRRPPAKPSVLEPSTSRWLDTESDDDSGTPVPDDLSPPELLSPENGPPPEMIPDDFPNVRGPQAMPESADFPGPFEHLPQQMIPRSKLRKQPMMRESWLFHPFNFSVFEGALFATPPIAPQFNTAVSYFTGFRIGWDYATHFGGETRFGFSKVFLLDATRSVEVGSQQIFYFDSNLLIYPFGDTRWRPFLSLGTGLADVLIVDNAGLRIHPGAFNMPMGFGIKYRYGPRIAFRADFRDNLTFSGAGGLRTLNNIEAVGGIEFHFGGGNRRSYWPWNPSHHWW